MGTTALIAGLLAGAAVLAASGPEMYPENPPAAERRALAARRAADPGLLRLEAAIFDPLLQGVPDFGPLLPEGPLLRAAGESRGSYHLVQLASRIDRGARARLARSGFEILGYVPNRALVVRFSREGPLPPPPAGTRFLGEFLPGYKMARELAIRTARGAPTEPMALDAWLFRDEDPRALVAAVLRHFPATRIEHVKESEPPRVRLVAAGDDARRVVGALLRDPSVQFVERHVPLELHNDASVWIGQSYDRLVGPSEAAGPAPVAYALSAPIWGHGLLGEGQVVAVGDTGLEYGMCRFRDPLHAVVPQSVDPPAPLLVDPAHRKILAYNAPAATGATTDDSFRHGSHTSGSVAGDDLAHPAEPGFAGHDHGDGMAPLAKIVFEDLSTAVSGACSTNIAVGSIADLLVQEHAAGARISTNSWGSSGGGNGAAFEIDTSAAALEDLLVVFSAGNNGAAGLTGQARCKNCLTVGASETHDASFLDEFGILDPENMTAFSSRGPTPDGRIKPDVVAPGYSVHSSRFPVQYFLDAGNAACGSGDVCFPSFGGCYVTDTSQECHVAPLLGTSMSTPIVAGLAALSREYFVKGFHANGEADPEQAHAPTAALLKAVLIHGARNMTGHLYERRPQAQADLGPLAPAPSDVQGWGRVVLDDALYFAGDARRVRYVDLPRASGLSTGSVLELDTAASGEQDLEVTLVWTDPPGQPFVSAALVDDLDLVIEGPGGIVYQGNGGDAVNNVESMEIAAPAPGSYTVRVVGVDVPGGAAPGTQGFALVVSGALSACTTAEPPATALLLAASESGITLAWSEVPGAAGYEVLRNQTSCADPMPYDQKGAVGAGESTFVDRNVVPGETYHYTVRAVMAPGCRTADSPCVSAAALPAGPPPAHGLTASRLDASGSVLEIRWDATTCPAPGYHLLWGDLAAVALPVLGGGECGLAGGSFVWNGAGAGDLWFLVASEDGAGVEGSWGSRTDGEPRGSGAASGVCGLTARVENDACP